jgi:phosphoribosylglycinamide formyltransferase-1
MAFASGVDTTGCTVHYVTEEVDTGPIILKREVVIRPGDTLETVTDRVHEAEDDILPQAIELACEKIIGERD